MDKDGRIAYLDLAKGICIILVVLFHVKGIVGCEYVIDPFLASFRLPLYFFLSGLFFRDYGSMGRFVRKKTNRLLVPFFSFYLLTAVLMPNLLQYAFGVQFNTVAGLPSLWAFIWPGEYPNIPIWFLWCLFQVNVWFWLLRRVVLCRREAMSLRAASTLAVACLSLSMVGRMLFLHFLADVGNAFKALESLPFFCLGFLFGKYDGLQALGCAGKAQVLTVFLLSFAVSFSASVFIPHPTQSVYFACYLLSGMSGALMIVSLARLLGHIPFVSYIGRYSIIVLLTHGVFVRMVAPWCASLSQHTSANVAVAATCAVVLLSYIVVIPLSRRFLPHVTAQKPLFTED